MVGLRGPPALGVLPECHLPGRRDHKVTADEGRGLLVDPVLRVSLAPEPLGMLAPVVVSEPRLIPAVRVAA